MDTSTLTAPGDTQRDFETDVLEVLYRAYPGTLPLLTMYHRRAGSDRGRPASKHFGEPEADEPKGWLGGMLRAGVVTASGFGPSESLDPSTQFGITPEGIRELSRRRGMATPEDLENVNRIALEGVAKIAELREATEGEHARLAAQVTEFEKQVADLDKAFYSRIFPFFAVFIGTFALIITGAQGAVRIESGEPALMFWRSAAIMGPVAILVLFLILLTWVVSRPR